MHLAMAIETCLQECALFLTQSTHHSDGQQGCERDVSAEDAVQVTVLSIAALKKVSKGTRILLLDRNGGQSKQIAKALAKKGFKKVMIAVCVHPYWYMLYQILGSGALQQRFKSTLVLCPS